MAKDQLLQGADRYGSKYWCIKSAASEDGELYVMADRLQVTEAGALIAWGGHRNKSSEAPAPETQIAVLVLAAGCWTAAYAASIMDGSPVAVEHWKGEAVRD
jgi:hypothetical protein